VGPHDTKRPIAIGHAAAEHPGVLYVFDCLVLNERDIRARPR
jgi:ATP-dependent DNA ligase